jgi:hypothetical protein
VVSLQGLLQSWAVLNDMLGHLRQMGAFIPDLTYADLRYAKMTLEYLRSFERDISATADADSRLREELEIRMFTLKESFMAWAEEAGGTDNRRVWEDRFDQALNGRLDLLEEERPVPISDLPREKDVGFFRIKLPDDMPIEVISDVAEDCGVNISLDGERHLQVSGNTECVRDAMKRLGELFYGKTRLEKP